MAAQQTLTLLVVVRIHYPQPRTNHAYAHGCKRNPIGLLRKPKKSHGLCDWDDGSD